MPFIPTSSDPLTALMEYGQAFNKTANINAHLEEGATPEEMLEYLQSTGRIATGERAAQLKDTESWGRIVPGAAADIAKTVLNVIPGMQGVAASIPSGETVSNQMSPEAAGALGSYIKSGLSPFASLLSTGTTGLQYGKEYMRQKGYEIPEAIDEGIDALSRNASELYKKPFETGDVTLAERGGGDIVEGWKNLTPDERARWLASGTGSVIGNAGTMLLGAGKTGKILSAIGNWTPTGKVGKFVKALSPEGYLLPIGALEAEEIFSGQLEEKARTNENLDLTRGLIASYAAMVSEKWGGGGRIIGNMLSGAGVKGKSAIGAIVREGLRGGLEESLFQEPLQAIIEEYGKTPKAIEEERFYTQTLPMAMEAGASALVGTTAMGGAHGAKGRSRAMWEHAQSESENVRDIKAMEQKQRDYFTSNIPQITSTLQSQPILNIMALQQSVASDPSAPTGIKEALASLVESKSAEATKAGLALPDETEISALSTRNKELYTPDSSSPLLGSFKLIVDKGDGNSVIGWHGNEITVPTLATKSPSSMRFDQMSTDEANSTLKFLHDSGFVSTRGYEALSQQLAQSPENLNRIMLNFQTVRDDLSKNVFKSTKNFQPAAIPGEYTRAVNDALLRGQINIYSGHATDTIPHEIAHPIWDSMPDSFKQAYTEYAKNTHEDFLKTPIGRTYANREDLRNYIANPQERFAIEFAEAYYVPALREHIERQKYTGSSIGRMVLAVKDFVRKVGSMMGAKPTGIAADVAIKNTKVTPEQLILINKQYKDMAGFGKVPAAKVTRADVTAKKEAEALPAKQVAREEDIKKERERATAISAAETEALGTFGENIEHPDWTGAQKVEPGAPASDLTVLEREHGAPAREALQTADMLEATGGGSDEAIRIAERAKERDVDTEKTRREKSERTAMEQAEEVRGKEMFDRRTIKQGDLAREQAVEESVGELGKRPYIEPTEDIEPQKARLSELESRMGQEAEASDIGRALSEQQKYEAQEAAEWASEYAPEGRVSQLSDADKRFYDAFSGEGVSYSLKPNPYIPYGKPQPVQGRFVLDIRGKRHPVIVNPTLLDAVSLSKQDGFYGAVRGLYDEQGGNVYIFSPSVLHNWVKDAMGWGEEGKSKGIHLVLNDIDIANLRAGNPESTYNWIDRNKQSQSLFDRPVERMNLKAAYPDTPVKFDRKSTGMWVEWNEKTGKWKGNGGSNYSIKNVDGYKTYIPSRDQLQALHDNSVYVMNDNFKTYLAIMKPEDFLSVAAKEIYPGEIRERTEGYGGFDNAKMEHTNIPRLYVDESGNVVGHEGRARSQMIADVGIKRMPVDIRSEFGKFHPEKNPVPNVIYGETNKKSSLDISGGIVLDRNVTVDEVMGKLESGTSYSYKPVQVVGNKYTGKAYRVPVENVGSTAKTAMDVVNFEANELGNSNVKKDAMAVARALGIDLKSVPAKDTVWVVGDRDTAEELYGYKESVAYPVKFSDNSVVLSHIGEDGTLVYDPDFKINYSYKPGTVSPEATTSSVIKAIYNDTTRMYDEFRKRKDAPAEPASADMSGIKTPLEQGFDELQSFEQLGRYNGRIARGLLGTINRLSKSHFWEKYLGSPEHFKHPVLQKLVHLFTEVRDTDRHKIFFHLDSFYDDMKRDMGITHVKAEKVSDAMADLKYQGATEKQKKFNLTYESKQYGLLRDMVEDGDIHYIRNRGDEETAENTGDIDERTQKLINKWKAKGASEETIEVWRMMRHSYDSALDLQLNKMAALKELLGQQKSTEQTKRMSDALTEAMEHMNSWRGFYAPRIRNRGDWVVRAKRKEADSSGKLKEAYFRDNAQTEAGALMLAEKLRQSGWDVAQPFLSQKPPEDVYNAVNVMDVRQILNAALERMSEEAKSEQDLDKRAQMEEANLAFSEDVIESIANVIRERGYRSTAIRRGEHYVSGYNVDPLGRFIWYLSNTSNGMAKATVAQEAIRLMAGEIKEDEQGNKYRTGGLNAAYDRAEYETARDYISNQLRNATLADEIVGYGKTAAALWFLTSPKSALVNLLALVTNAPPVISHVVTGGKYANYKVAKDISKATSDYYAYWRNKDNARLAEDERAFMKWVKENEHDAPEFTRASLQLAKNPFQTATATLMDKALMFFANTEKLNRGATLLAAYRIARDEMGMDTINAARRIAVEATWKTHGKYGKGTDIMLAQGTGILPRVAQMAYTFSKFPHNHLQMMKRMATKDSGMSQRDWKNFCWMLMMPMLLVGGAGLPFRDQWFKLFGAMARMFGFQGDAQKFFHDQVRANFGSRAEKFARSGLLGQLGMDVTGSIGIGAPNITPWSLGGAAGGVLKNLVDAGHYAKTGQTMRAFETAAPTVIGSVLKGVRETGGIKTKEGYTLFTPEGKPYIPDTYETLLRILGFRSSEASMQSSRVWEIRAEKQPFTDARNNIYEEIRSAITFNDEGKPVVNEKAIKEVQEKANEYNKKVDKYNASMGIKGWKSSSMVPYITPTSFKNQLQNAAKPKKQALKELKTLQ